MLIQITNTCRMGCPHCMDAATEEPKHMSSETFGQAIGLAERLGVRALVISGGEPTEHPEWDRFVSLAAKKFQSVSIPTNGAWLFSPRKHSLMTDILRSFSSVKLQISSFEGLYKDHVRTVAATREYALELKALGLKKRMYLETDRKTIDVKMVELGRCCDSPRLAEIAKVSSCTASCITGSVLAAQTTIGNVIRTLEQKGHFCKPLIGWDGGLRYSESCLCPPFAYVSEDFRTIEEKSSSWRPCGSCAGYRKLCESDEPKYLMAKIILGIGGTRHC